MQAHLLSDVPLGLFLSGGLDSAAVLALAPRGQNSLGFSQASHDESARAAELACQFGGQHTRLQIDAFQAAEFLPGFLAAIDQPTVDGFNSYCVSALASQQGLKVVLSGLGGDELFGGYPSFSRIPRLLRWHRRLGSLRPVVARLLAQRPSHRQQRLAAFLLGPATTAAAYRCQRCLFAPNEVKLLLQHWQLENDGPIFEPTAVVCSSLADEIAWLESRNYMGQQLLRDSDVFSMAHGLELRLPLVDTQLLADIAGIPATQRLASGKKLLQAAVPEILERLPPVTKRGFSFPFQNWFELPNSPMRPGAALPAEYAERDGPQPLGTKMELIGSESLVKQTPGYGASVDWGAVRVLHVIPSISPLRGGPSAAVLAMVAALRKQGVEASILTTNDNGHGIDCSMPLGHWFDRSGVPVLAFRRWSPPVRALREFAISPELNAWLSSHIHHYQLLHIHALFSWPSSSSMVFARRAGVPMCCVR